MRRLLARLAARCRIRGPHVAAVLVAGLLAAGIGIVADLADLLPGVQSDTVALRFQARAAESPADVAVVAIDDVTFSDLRRGRTVVVRAGHSYLARRR